MINYGLHGVFHRSLRRSHLWLITIVICVMSNHIVIAFNLLINALWRYALYVMQKYKKQLEIQMECVKSMIHEAIVRYLREL